MAVVSPIPRLLSKPSRSFFLLGPRGTGKSTWLKKAFTGMPRLDLLDASLCLELSSNPRRLESILGNLPHSSRLLLRRGGWTGEVGNRSGMDGTPAALTRKWEERHHPVS